LGQTVSTVNEATRLLQLTQIGLSCMTRRLLDQNCFNSQCSDVAAAINTGWSVILTRRLCVKQYRVNLAMRLLPFNTGGSVMLTRRLSGQKAAAI
jgi:hypothetical protein